MNAQTAFALFLLVFPFVGAGVGWLFTKLNPDSKTEKEKQNGNLG